jgi:PQQ-dependent dehydrogenase (methanol/ethanol family)
MQVTASSGGVSRHWSIGFIIFCIAAGAAAQTTTTATTTATAAALSMQPPEQEDGQWPMPAKNYRADRYSGLDQINTDNVKNLKVAWEFSLGINRGQEAPPIVVGDTMYVTTPYPNLLYAFDLNKGAHGESPLKWQYDPNASPASQGVACCDTVNRGCVYSDGRIYYSTLDVQTVCVDAKTGKEVWKSKLGDINHGETITMAPLVVKGKVLVGNSGGEMGVRGWLKALDAKDGKLLWTAWSTGPDSDCLIGPNFKPPYPAERGKDLGMHTWPPEKWKIGGGTVWGWVSYDPELNLIFYGTSNPGVWNPDLRPGDNKWSSTIFARNPDDGQAAWAYQYSPHDLWDYDAVNENIVVNLPIDGQTRKVLLHPDRTGYLYVQDRTSGELVSATPFVRVTSTKGIDLKSGRPIENAEKHPDTGKVIRDVAPAAPGGKDWQPCAFSYRTGLLYIPHQELTMDFESTEANYIEGTPYVGANVKMYAWKKDGNRGEYCAWDPVAKKKAWAITERFPVWSGTVVTAGDVAFYGTMDGLFKAVDARNGKPLWQFRTPSGIVGQPTTFKGPDGKQYVAIVSGVGGWSGAIVAGGLDGRDPTAALGFVNAMKDLPSVTQKGGTLHVFGLP